MLWQGYSVIHYTTWSFRIVSFCGTAYLGAVDIHILELGSISVLINSLSWQLKRC